jgi:Peptidase M15
VILTLDMYLGKHAHGPFAHEATAEVMAAASKLLERVNAILAHALAAGVTMEVHPETGSWISSGWRPAGYNAKVPGAAKRSLHITGHALDLYDADGDFDEWLFHFGAPLMTSLGLWAEHPSATRRWSHLQIIAPKSGRRFYYP